MLDGAAQIRARQRVVDDERDPRLIRDPCDRRNIGDVAPGVRDRLDEDRPGVVVDGGAHGGLVVKVHERGRPAEAADRLPELRNRAAVEPGRGDYVQPRTHQRQEREDLRRVPRRTADRARAPFQRGDAVLQRADGRVRQPRIDVADLLQVEEPGGVVGVPELVGGGLVDRHLPRASGRVGGGARVDGERVEALRAGGGGRVGHGVPL